MCSPGKLVLSLYCQQRLISGDLSMNCRGLVFMCDVCLCVYGKFVECMFMFIWIIACERDYCTK